MSSRQSGMTLIELIFAIVVISVGLTGLLLALNTTIRGSADPMVQKQMLAIAEEMMEEVLLKPYTQPTGVNTPGSISGCNRASADDIGDYAGYSQSVCDIDGNSIAALAGYTVSVAVDKTASLDTQVSDVAKITVTVTHSGTSFSLIGYRTNYAS